jgi:hypothetical protein
MSDLDEYCRRYPVQLSVVDVRVPWLSQDFRGVQLPDEDWRFTALLPDGAHVTFGSADTAAEIASYLQREGVKPTPGRDDTQP